MSTVPVSTVRDPAAPLWGPRTDAAIATVDVHGVRLGSVPVLVVALAAVKEAAVRANLALGRVSGPVAAAVAAASREVADGRWLDQFPVDVHLGGSAAHLHANVDEVLAARAARLAGPDVTVDVADLALGQGEAGTGLHPVALRLALILAAYDLRDDLRRLRLELRDRAAALTYAAVGDPAILQSLRQRLRGYANDVAYQEVAVEESLVELHLVPMPAAGEPERQFAAVVADELSTTTGLAFGTGTPTLGALLRLSRVLHHLSLRLAQVWTGLATLTAAAARTRPGSAERRTELINATVVDVVAATRQDDLVAAEAPAIRPESRLTMSLVTSMTRLSEAALTIADGCRADRPMRTTLAA